MEELYNEWITVKQSRNKQLRKDFFIKTRDIHKKKCACNVGYVLDVFFPRYFRENGIG